MHRVTCDVQMVPFSHQVITDPRSISYIVEYNNDICKDDKMKIENVELSQGRVGVRNAQRDP